MKILQIFAIFISAIFIGGSVYAGCAATANFDKAMAGYNLTELSQSKQDNISELSKDCKSILHTGKAMASIGSCTEALDIAKGSS